MIKAMNLTHFTSTPLTQLGSHGVVLVSIQKAKGAASLLLLQIGID